MKATKINLLDFKSVPMRTFHITWITFFLCFFGWFGIAPLMPVVRENLGLTKQQIGNIIIASVAITIFARLFFGWLCDRIGPQNIVYNIALGWVDPGNVYRFQQQLRNLPPVPPSHWGNWSFICHYAVSHFSNVCSECRWYCQCYIGWMG